MNDRFLDYKIPNIGDMPEIEAICVESVGTNGPFGAKGIGEPGLVPTAPAIANAVFDAIGVRFHELPITRDQVLEALKEQRAIAGRAQAVAQRTLGDALGAGAPGARRAGRCGRQDERAARCWPASLRPPAARVDRDHDDGHVRARVARGRPDGRGGHRRGRSRCD